jgi:hypothetical protein
MIPSDENGNNVLTGQKGYHFTLTELEVWEVRLSENFNKVDYLKKMESIIQQNIEKYGNTKCRHPDTGKEMSYKEKMQYIRTKLPWWYPNDKK